jgi:hypothetical protein
MIESSEPVKGAVIFGCSFNFEGNGDGGYVSMFSHLLFLLFFGRLELFVESVKGWGLIHYSI